MRWLERMNGILKQEYGLGAELPSKEIAYLAVSNKGSEALQHAPTPWRALKYQSASARGARGSA